RGVTTMYRAIRKYAFLSTMPSVAAVLLLAGSASAQQPVNTCGQTLKQSGVYVLTTDLDCSGTFANGINITASNITFHLGNHTLSSTDCDSNREIYGVVASG